MAQWRLLKQLKNKRCELMWNFLNEIPGKLTRRVSAWIGREAHADAMYRGSSPSRNTHQADRSARAINPLFICLLGVGTLNPVVVVFGAERCPATNATKVVSVQGNVTWSVISNATLTAAKLNDLLCVGDTVRVGAKSRAVLRLPNETTIPLDQNTIFQLKEAISEKDPTLIELLQGAIHIITRTPKPFKVNTPYLNAVVEGTEFYVGVGSQEARVAVIEGKVNVSNEQGTVLLTDNEAASARKGQAPQKTLTIKPRDAVQWALYYPPLFDPRSRSESQNLANAHELYSQGKITEAIESLDAIPKTERNGDYYSYKAGLLLLVGRADEAEPDIETALKENQNNTDALSLKAIIAIVKNDKAKALELANQAVNIDDKSASARIALSYALQANFKIEDALKQATQATEREPNNALAWARVAELELSIPNYDKSKDAAEKAVALNPNLARTQAVLGFANLTRIDIKEAKNNFDRAIDRDQADPLSRLGLGLAIIREGNLAQGREQIEIAASLDPENSLIRSYLGKAYYEEKRDQEAGKQFELAKERDPKDPTSYYYDAIRKQTANGPVEALEALEEASDLNSYRSVYRSSLALDDDGAAKTASIADVYGRLGFNQLAIVESSRALMEDPGNYSAHRVLASAYANLPRHDIARVSEALQAQLRQNLTASPIDPQLTTDNLFILRGAGPTLLGTNEYGLLFERNQGRLQLSTMGGNRQTVGNDLVISGVINKFAYALTQLHYETKGFLANDSSEKDVYSVFLQSDLSERTSMQAEIKRAALQTGQTFFGFDSENLFPVRFDETADSVRLGVHHRFNSSVDLIALALHEDKDTDFSTVGDPTFTSERNTKSNSGEIQQLFKFQNFQVIAGLGHLESRATQLSFERNATSNNAYFYSQWRSNSRAVSLNLGVAAEEIEVNQTEMEEPFKRRRLSPKIAFAWSPTNGTTFRAAALSALRRPFIGSQTLEPTAVVGFNQFFSSFDRIFGEPEGTSSNRLCIAVDQKVSPRLFLGAELTARKLKVPIISEKEQVSWRENTARTYFYHAISPNAMRNFLPRWQMTSSIEYEYERIQRDADLTGPESIRDVVSHRIPLGVRLFSDSRFFAQLGTTYVRQSGTFQVGTGFPEFRKNDRAWITDASIGYSFAKRRGQFSIAVKNLLNQSITLLETDPLNPRVPSKRFVFGKLRLVF
jgi:tetratricopeptide (TPR) repeat protein